MNQSQINAFLQCLAHADSLPFWQSFKNASKANDNDNDDDHEHDHEHNHDNHDEENSDLLTAKVVAMLVLFCASSLCGSIPFMLNRFLKWTDQNANARSALIVQLLLYFGGGVLLCTTFQHLLPEVQETIAQLQECNYLPALSFSLAELLMCIGFFLMYFIEEVIHTYIHRHRRLLEKDANTVAAFQRGQSVRNSYLMKQKQQRNSNDSMDSKSCATLDTVDIDADRNLSNTIQLSVQDLLDQNDVKNLKYDTSNSKPHAVACQHKHEAEKPAYNQHHHHDDDHQQHHSHLPLPTESDDMIASSLRGFFIVLALSLHELFEGMAIGLEGSASAVWFMFGAVSAHKLVLAFCVGVELIVARTRLALSIVYIFTFAFVSPLGIGIGILISHDDHGSAPSVPSALLQGFACGTLLYVVFFEILNKNRSGLLPYLALLVGFAVMFGIQQLGISGDGHGHSHGHCHNDDHNDNLENDLKLALLNANDKHALRAEYTSSGESKQEQRSDSNSSNNNNNNLDLKGQLQMLRQTSQRLIKVISQSDHQPSTLSIQNSNK